MNRFVHLNVHSHYSIMDGCANIRELVDAAIKNRMPGIAITDNGNMFGIMEFYKYVSRINIERKKERKSPFKPIIGCELYVAEGSKKEKELGKKCNGSRLTVLAKNYKGYKNLIKIVSNSWTDGFFIRPRTDHDALKKYHEGLIVLSGGIRSELYTHIVNDDMTGLDETIKWYKQIFSDDYYLELQRTVDYELKDDKPSDLMLEQEKVNSILIQKGKELGVKVVATNDVHYVAPEDLSAYNILSCVASGKTMEEFASQVSLSFRWLRSENEMTIVFSDIVEALTSTWDIFDKVEFYDICHAPMAPAIEIPDSFGKEKPKNEEDYLEYLTFSKAKQIYGESLSEEVTDRLKYELQIIKQKGASGYFLFMQYLVNTAQSKLGVRVGPGRGSVGGSLVCYCLGITKIDPLKHDLLFERFLSPEGTMFPDIDIDFDDEGRECVIKWLQQKYGKECCAHVIDFSTFFPFEETFKTVAKVQNIPSAQYLPLYEAIYSDDFHPYCSIKSAITYNSKIRRMYRNADLRLRTANENAEVLNRKVRDIGVHVSGFIVANEPVSNWAPIATIDIKDSHGNQRILNCVQYDDWNVESSGIIKFDFVSLETLSKMRDICKLIKSQKDADINIDMIPIDDEKTLELFQTGQTEDIFQFRSEVVQDYLHDLHPTCFEDLVILYCLYRPGPMKDIPTLIRRKKSKKGIKYIIPCMEKYLQNTYGLIVNQEQLMMLSRSIADFSRGESDLLRKALGLRQMDVLSLLKPRFIEGGIKNGHKKNALEKVWNEMERKGMYAFNKSHAVCYTWLAYQMAYLKANYPDEFKQVMNNRNLSSQ